MARRVAATPAGTVDRGRPACSAPPRSSASPGSSPSASGSRRPTRTSASRCASSTSTCPSAWLAYLAFVVTAVASAIYLFGKRHSLGWDRLAGASAEVGVLFMGITLVTGMLWGRLTWGVFWEWDARLTTTAFLFVTYVGYLAVRRLGGTPRAAGPAQRRAGPARRARDPARPLERRLWRSLHQEATRAATRRRRQDGRADAVHPVRRHRRLHPAVRLAGDPPPAHAGRRGRPRRRRPRPGHRRRAEAEASEVA